MFFCKFCELEFSRSDNYKRHVLTSSHKTKVKQTKVTPKVPYKCDKCKFESTKKSDYKDHLETKKHKINVGELNQNEKQFYQCLKCDYKTSRSNDLEKHKLTHNDKKIKCDICDKKYRNEEQYQIHLNSDLHNRNCRMKIMQIKGKIDKIKHEIMNKKNILKIEIDENMYSLEEQNEIKEYQIQIKIITDLNQFDKKK
jgi:hypothetical protein